MPVYLNFVRANHAHKLLDTNLFLGNDFNSLKARFININSVRNKFDLETDLIKDKTLTF